MIFDEIISEQLVFGRCFVLSGFNLTIPGIHKSLTGCLRHNVILAPTVMVPLEQNRRLARKIELVMYLHFK